MKYDNGERYLEEINHVSILEPIDEKFDSATSLLTPNAVMYGSTVTALISGLEICGDLDIAVSNQEYMTLCQNFSSSVKWLQVDGKRIPERKAADHSRAFALPSLNNNSPSDSYPAIPPGKNKYAAAKHLPINKMVAFQTVNNSRVQIVQSKTMTGDRLEDALEVVRKVDFTFCGVAVDMYGRMLEVIPHAYDDCNQRVIRIHDYHPQIDHKNLENRLHKYIRRGWSLTMSIDQAMANLNKAKMKYAKSLGGKKSKKRKVKTASFFRLRRNPQKDGYLIEAKDEIVRLLGANSPICDSLRWNANKQFGLDINYTVTHKGVLTFWCDKHPLSSVKANKIISMTNSHLESKYSSHLDRIKREKQEKKTANLYSIGHKYGSYGSATSTSSSNW